MPMDIEFPSFWLPFAFSLHPRLSNLLWASFPQNFIFRFLDFVFCILVFAFPLPSCLSHLWGRRKVGWTDFGKDLSFRQQLMLSQSHSHQQVFLISQFVFCHGDDGLTMMAQIRLMNEQLMMGWPSVQSSFIAPTWAQYNLTIPPSIPSSPTIYTETVFFFKTASVFNLTDPFYIYKVSL